MKKERKKATSKKKKSKAQPSRGRDADISAEATFSSSGPKGSLQEPIDKDTLDPSGLSGDMVRKEKLAVNLRSVVGAGSSKPTQPRSMLLTRRVA